MIKRALQQPTDNDSKADIEMQNFLDWKASRTGNDDVPIPELVRASRLERGLRTGYLDMIFDRKEECPSVDEIERADLHQLYIWRYSTKKPESREERHSHCLIICSINKHSFNRREDTKKQILGENINRIKEEIRSLYESMDLTNTEEEQCQQR